MPTSKENLRINGFVADLILLVFKNSRFLSLRPSFLFLFFFNVLLWYFQRFPSSLAGKESTCNSGEEGLIPGSGRSPGEGNGNLLQYSCLGNPIQLTADFSSETLQARREWQDIFKALKGRKSTTKITVPGKDLIQN